jgi:hypothetical protein
MFVLSFFSFFLFFFMDNIYVHLFVTTVGGFPYCFTHQIVIILWSGNGT